MLRLFLILMACHDSHRASDRLPEQPPPRVAMIRQSDAEHLFLYEVIFAPTVEDIGGKAAAVVHRTSEHVRHQVIEVKWHSLKVVDRHGKVKRDRPEKLLLPGRMVIILDGDRIDPVYSQIFRDDSLFLILSD